MIALAGRRGVCQGDRVRALAILSVLALTGCGAAAPPASVVDAVPTAVTPEGDAETIGLDPTNTKVEVEVTAVMSHTVRFKSTGSLTISPKNVVASSVDLVIDTTSASASMGMVEDMAKSEDFLAVATYPTATFRSQSLAKAPDDKLDLFGELSLHGTTKMLKVPAAVAIDPCEVKVQTEFTLDRHAYHVESSNSIDGSVGDEILVRIDVHAKRPSAPATCPAKES
ncbi:MAG: YceI family protein [Polyangiaceae bacterium]